MRDEKCVSGAVPYGYYRKPEDKQTLYVDELSASVVRRIFQFACKGMGATAIADGLPNRDLWRDFLNFPYFTGFPAP